VPVVEGPPGVRERDTTGGIPEDGVPQAHFERARRRTDPLPLLTCHDASTRSGVSPSHFCGG